MHVISRDVLGRGLSKDSSLGRHDPTNLAVHQNCHAMSVLMNLAQNNSRKSLQQAADAEMKALEESIQAEIRALEVLMPRLNSFVFRSSAR